MIEKLDLKLKELEENKEKQIQYINKLNIEREQSMANLNAIEGAIQVLRELLIGENEKPQ